MDAPRDKKVKVAEKGRTGPADARERQGLDVVGIGSMVVDRMHRAPRILGGDAKGMLRDAAPGRSVVRHVGGVVLNHLGWARALGLRCGIFGRQGDDDDGRFLRAAMDRAGIERDLVLVDDPTSLAEIFVDDAGSRAIYMAPGATAHTTPAQVRASHAPFIARAARFTTEVSQLPLAVALEALRVATEAGVATLVDLDVPPSDAVGVLGTRAELDEVLRSAQILKPSKSAAAELAPEGVRGALALAHALRERFGSEAVVITDGERGCAVSAKDFEGEIAAPAVAVVDTTGAGDAFLGGLLVGLARGLDWPETAALANAAGGACAEVLGAFPADPARARERVRALYELDDSRAPLALGPLVPRGAAVKRLDTEEAPAARAVLEVAREALSRLEEDADGATYARAASLVQRCCEKGGRVHALGVGKAGYVARYAAALLSSTGTPAAGLDVLEVPHGSAGQVRDGDVVIAISHSGETEELIAAVELLRSRGASIVAVVGEPDSPLARLADCALDASVAREGGPLDLAPRASTLAEVSVVAALAAELQVRMGQTRAGYAALHPAGSLGRKARS